MAAGRSVKAPSRAGGIGRRDLLRHSRSRESSRPRRRGSQEDLDSPRSIDGVCRCRGAELGARADAEVGS